MQHQAGAPAQGGLDEGRGGQLRRRQHRDVADQLTDRTGQGRVEETHDQTSLGRQLLDFQRDVQVGQIAVPQQRARASSLDPCRPQRLLTQRGADDQRHLRGLRGSREETMVVDAHDDHRDVQLVQLLQDAHAEGVVPHEDDMALGVQGSSR